MSFNSRYFDPSEFQCSCCSVEKMDDGFVRGLHIVREKFDRPMILNSAYRCERHNLRVGGSPTSQHLLGTAADISTVNYSSAELFKLIELLSTYMNGIGVYKTFVHADKRNGLKSAWVG